MEVRSRFYLSTRYVPGNEFRSSGLAVDILPTEASCHLQLETLKSLELFTSSEYALLKIRLFLLYN